MAATAVVKKGPKKSAKSEAEDKLWFHLRAIGQQSLWKRQVKFHPTRQWRFDMARPDIKLAVEVEGITFGEDAGRHQRGPGMRADCEKYAEAMCLGWRVLRVVPDHVKSGQAIGWIEQICRLLR